MSLRIINVSKNTILADKARMANNVLTRFIGLLNRHTFHEGEALILVPSYCVHSFFMRFTFDALFLSEDGTIVGASPSLRPFRVSPIYFKAHTTIELPENTIRTTQTQIGDIIKIETVANAIEKVSF